MTSGTLRIVRPGIQSLLTDKGRFGHNRLGLTVGGPMDDYGFTLANRLCGNPDNTSCIEILAGGFECVVNTFAQIAVTGAQTSLTINGDIKPLWVSHPLSPGDRLVIGQVNTGLRNYLAVQGGFRVKKAFSSTTTVVRDGVGGLDGCGSPLKPGDLLGITHSDNSQHRAIAQAHIPNYPNSVLLRVIPGYQFSDIPARSRLRFFHSEYRLTQDMDRMAVRLTGPKVEHDIRTMFSEGICYGAVQLPADGQPIIMLNDRQTIGGYPKLGSILSLDGARLAQYKPGTAVRFRQIDMLTAHNLVNLYHHKLANICAACN